MIIPEFSGPETSVRKLRILSRNVIKILKSMQILIHLFTFDTNKIKYIIKVAPKILTKSLSVYYIIRDLDHNEFAFNLKNEREKLSD